MLEWSQSRKYGAIRRIRHSRRWLQRLTRRAKRYYPSPDPGSRQLLTWTDVEAWRRNYVRQRYAARKPFSYDMWGNPRKYFGAMTTQEARAADEAWSQCDDAGVSCGRPRFRKSF